MPFVERILEFSSVAFVGMDKNCGKTEAMNYFLRKANSLKSKILAVTSIGIDGEQIDQVTNTPKPEITLCEGNLFVTCEAYYPIRKLHSEVIDLSSGRTALGRLVTARVVDSGEVILAGASDTQSLRRDIVRLKSLGVDLVVVDGALARKSIASPSITDALVLSTGAAISHNIADIVTKSAYQVELIELEQCSIDVVRDANSCSRGIYNITDEGLIDTQAGSLFSAKSSINNLLSLSTKLLFTGVINDSLLEGLIPQRSIESIEIVVMDFTKVFVTRPTLHRFLSRGGKLTVVNKSQLAAVCVNPRSPLGYVVDSDELTKRLSDRISREVYDVKRL